jgi:uncharacterized protein (DUF697 family)
VRLHPGIVIGLLKELRTAAEDDRPLVVTGAPALAEVLRRELGAGGRPGWVRGGPAERAAVLVHVLAAPPGEEDERVLGAAARARVPIVAVLAGPELEPRVPHVLATDVVRVEAGHGFPVGEIARVVAHALGESATSLAAALPVLRPAVCEQLIERFSRKAAIVGVAVFVPGADLPALLTGQVRLVLRIAAAHGVEVGRERLPEVLGVVAAGLGFRAVSRRAVRGLPLPHWAVKGAVAYAGTRAVGEAAVRLYGARVDAARAEPASVRSGT